MNTACKTALASRKPHQGSKLKSLKMRPVWSGFSPEIVTGSDGCWYDPVVGSLIYINQYYEKNLTTEEETSHYYLGGKQIAYKKDTTLEYVHTNHLGSTSVTTSASGTEVSTVKYFPFGGTRSSTGNVGTDKLFTGQRLDETGLYFYNARYYDATIGRFISPDTIVPEPFDPQSLNRYSYCLNNPLKYTDPTGFLTEDEIAENFSSVDAESALYAMLLEARWGDIIMITTEGGYQGSFVLNYLGSRGFCPVSWGGDRPICHTYDITEWIGALEGEYGTVYATIYFTERSDYFENGWEGNEWYRYNIGHELAGLASINFGESIISTGRSLPYLLRGDFQSSSGAAWRMYVADILDYAANSLDAINQGGVTHGDVIVGSGAIIGGNTYGKQLLSYALAIGYIFGSNILRAAADYVDIRDY